MGLTPGIPGVSSPFRSETPEMEVAEASSYLPGVMRPGGRCPKPGRARPPTNSAGTFQARGSPGPTSGPGASDRPVPAVLDSLPGVGPGGKTLGPAAELRNLSDRGARHRPIRSRCIRPGRRGRITPGPYPQRHH
eukprot:758405-Hanusia_phi.AAC.1